MDLEGREYIKNFKSNNLKEIGSNGFDIMFRTLLNPVDYDGSLWRNIKDSYKTNELGFFITLSFFVCLSWSFLKYRRNAILE